MRTWPSCLSLTQTPRLKDRFLACSAEFCRSLLCGEERPSPVAFFLILMRWLLGTQTSHPHPIRREVRRIRGTTPGNLSWSAGTQWLSQQRHPQTSSPSRLAHTATLAARAPSDVTVLKGHIAATDPALSVRTERAGVAPRQQSLHSLRGFWIRGEDLGEWR